MELGPAANGPAESGPDGGGAGYESGAGGTGCEGRA
jgi:hypothetical protein